MIKKIPTASMSKEDWVKLRSATIGGSDASAILGLNPYKSRYSLWAEKTGKVIPEDVSWKEAVRLGTDLEEYVASRFTEATGKKVRRENYMIFRDDMPYSHANYDRLVIGEKAGLECKTTNALHMSKFKNGEFPTNYYCQCVHYLMVSGLERWYLAVLVLGMDFKVFCIERDEDEIEALRMAEENFWDMVQKEIPPEIDGSVSTEDTISAEFPAGVDGTVVDLTTFAGDFAVMDECARQIKALEEKKRAAQSRIMHYMGNAECGGCGVYRATWKTQTRNTFDRKKFENDHGRIGEEYFKTSESRTFRYRKGE